jgi:hypothetical protein
MRCGGDHTRSDDRQGAPVSSAGRLQTPFTPYKQTGLGYGQAKQRWNTGTSQGRPVFDGRSQGEIDTLKIFRYHALIQPGRTQALPKHD